MYLVKKIFKTTALSFLAVITLFGNIVSTAKNLENKDLEITDLSGKEMQLELFNEENVFQSFGSVSQFLIETNAEEIEKKISISKIMKRKDKKYLKEFKRI